MMFKFWWTNKSTGIWPLKNSFFWKEGREEGKRERINFSSIWFWEKNFFGSVFAFQAHNWIWSPNRGWIWLAFLYGPDQPCWFCHCSDKEWTALLQLWPGKWGHQNNDSKQNQWWPVAQGIQCGGMLRSAREILDLFRRSAWNLHELNF